MPFTVVIALTLGFLLYFSLHYHEIPRPGWTHIGDPSYLSPVYLSIFSIFILLLFAKAVLYNTKVLAVFKSVLIGLIFINLAINVYITFKEWGNYTLENNIYKVPNSDLEELYENIKLELSKGYQPVFIDNELTVRSFRISQYAGAAAINANELKTIDQIPSNLVFFFILPEEEFFREEDNQLVNWGKKYNLKIIGKVIQQSCTV